MYKKTLLKNKGEEKQKEILKATVFFVPHSHRTFFSYFSEGQCVISLRYLHPTFSVY